MLTTIWKYSLDLSDSKQIELPSGAIFLSLQTQYGVPCAWFQVDESAKKETRTIYTYGTGHPISDIATKQYLGTWQSIGGSLVWHVYISK